MTESPGITKTVLPKKKSWKVYLFEFTLVLLAVFMGFLADNIREQYSDRRQGLEYLKSFYEDLLTDTSRISAIIRHEEEKIGILDATLPCYDSVTANPPNTQCLATLVRNSIVSSPFIISERTIQQLMAGGFRLIEKQDTDSITRYMSLYHYLLDHQNTVYHESQLEVRDSQNDLIHFRAFSRIASIDVTRNDGTFRLPSGVNLLLRRDEVAINRIFNQLHKYKLVTLGHVNQLRIMRENQMRLINYFREKYGFE